MVMDNNDRSPGHLRCLILKSFALAIHRFLNWAFTHIGYKYSHTFDFFI